MNPERLQRILEDVGNGRLSTQRALERLRHLPFEDLGFAKIDHQRPLRAGMPEVIFGEGKLPADVAKIFTQIAKHGSNVLVTRATRQHYLAVRKRLRAARFHPRARCITLRQCDSIHGKGTIAVVCAGTSDLPIAEEAVITAEMMGNRVKLIVDVGVAGLHRLLAHHRELRQACAIIVCAGMEGALPSVIAGLVPGPVIAVPTSVGYGASFRGVAALLAMLNSCAPNVCVVNIDNGFSAACVASAINRG